MEDKNLFIGLDIGTESVGWAATDENYKLYRIKGKNAWGSRIFEEAHDAKKRRLKRTNKRRMARRAYRIKLLNELFSPMIEGIDNTFFYRISESNLRYEHRKIRNNYLFLSKDKEKEFYKAYPTIWHLRNSLYNNDLNAFSDVRNVYLAIHHIIKYRGNFLKEGEFDRSFDDSIFEYINNFFSELVCEYEEGYDDYVLIDKNNIESIKNVLRSDEGKAYKKKELKKLFNSISNKEISNYIDFFITLLVGGKFDIAKLDKENFKSMSVSFTSAYDENESEIQGILGEKFNIVRYAKIIFDYFQLEELIGEHKNISAAFASVYNLHKIQLLDLKKLCKNLDTHFNLEGKNAIYFKIFKDKQSNNNYCALVGNNNDNKRSGDQHEFCKFVSNTLNEYSDYLNTYPGFDVLKRILDKEELLEVIANKSTGVIPHQLHKQELEVILDNAIKFYPEISKIKDKVISLFMYKIPYYYGPLDNRSPYSSVVRYSNEVVTPWNIDNVINDEETRKKFINNLTNSCKYLFDETTVLPKESLLYQRYIILDRLNTISINGARIAKEVRDNVLKNLILRNKKTTYSQIERFLKKEYSVYSKDGVAISGINKNDDFNNSSLYFFLKFFETNQLNKEQTQLAEKIIYYFSIFTDKISDAISFICKDIGGLTNKQKDLLKTASFKGWSPYSLKLLKGIKSSNELGECYYIITAMEEKVKNFQEILFDEELNFNKVIEDHNKVIIGGRNEDELVDEIIESTPPKMRRSVIQAVRIVDEIVKFAKKTPKYIAIEVTRENDPKKKGKETTAREKQINDFIKALKKDKDEYFKTQASEVEKSLQNLKETNQIGKIRNKHVYLYFMQCGLDLYTGKKIDINDVVSGTKYDTDHIIPQRLIKDDSLDNLVLVNKSDNQHKGGEYPLPDKILTNQDVRRIWKFLHDKKFLSDKKYNNLIRTNPLTNDELSGFVNAQINVVNQSNIVIRDILSIKYPGTTLIFSKAHYPALIRKEYQIAKLRELNDAHHAVDAYLNIVAGVILHKRYSTKFWMDEDINVIDNESMNMDKTLLYSLKQNNLCDKVVDTCNRRDQLLTYRHQYQEDKFYKETIYRHSDASLIPVHTKNPMVDTTVYGGYAEKQTAYFATAEIKNKNKITKTLVPVHWIDVKTFGEDGAFARIQDKLGTQASVAKRKILLNQKIVYNGAEYLLMSKGESINLKLVTPLFLESSHVLYLSKYQKIKDELINRNEDSVILFTNRENTKFIEFSKTINKEILMCLVKRAEHPIFDNCSMICKIREFKNENKMTEFVELSIKEQIEILFSIICLFTRKSRDSKLTPNAYLKTASFVNNDVLIKYESITGLESHTKKI